MQFQQEAPFARRSTRSFSEAADHEEGPGSLLCDTCGKTYARLDHLVRHQRSRKFSRLYSISRSAKK